MEQTPTSFPLFLSTSLHTYFVPYWKIYFSSVGLIGYIRDSILGLVNNHVAQGERMFQEQLIRWKSVLRMEAKARVKTDGQLC